MPSIKLFVKTLALVVMVAAVFGPFGVLQQTPEVRAIAVGDSCTVNIASPDALPQQINGKWDGTKCVGSNGEVAPSAGGVTSDSKGNLVNSTCSTLTNCLAWVVYWIGPGFASWVASISAYFFDFIVRISLNSTAYALTFLTTSWGLVLNLANMFFIFILIYSAFVIMLRAETARTMQILAWVIAIALVVNFSFFFTRIVIDAGNILATQFYNGIVMQDNIKGATINGSTDPNAPVDITVGIMKSLGVEKVLDTNGFSAVQAVVGTGNAPWSTLLVLTVVYLAVAVMLWMLALGLLMIAIKFLVRVVGLWFVLIASPLAFVSKTLPKTQHFFDTWLRTLVGFSFYPAIFLFMFFVLNKFVQELTQGGIFAALTQQNAVAGVATNPLPIITMLADVFIRMGFLIVMMYIMLKVADWIMEQTGGLASTFINKAGGALGVGFQGAAGTFGFASRQTFGRGATALSKSSRIATGAQKQGLVGTLWRGAERATKNLSSATYDVRNAPGAGLVKKVFEKAGGIAPNVGKSATKGFAEQAKEKHEKQDKERKERAAIVRDAANKEALKRIDEDVKSGRTHNPKDVDRIKNLSKRETEQIKVAELENVAHIITNAQLKTVTDSDKFTDADKEKLRLAWNQKSTDAPLAKAQKVLTNELRPLVTAMSGVGINLATIAANSAAGHTLEGAGILAMKDELNTKMAEIRSDIRSAAPGANTKDIQRNLVTLQNGMKTVERLDDERKKVPADVGGHIDEGKFVIA